MAIQPSSGPKAPDDPSQPSRKRQRSQSMQSDASSSSLKRPVADGNSHDGVVRSPRADQMSTLTLTDPNQDIDAYMAEQGEDDNPVLASLTSSPRQSAHAFQLVPPGEKLALVERGRSRKMEAGETWYLISRDWWKRWKKACTGEIDKEGLVSEQDLGPVDNSRLLDSYGNLQSSLVEGVDLEYVPEEVWKLFFDWYGEAIHPLPRRVIERGTSKQTSIELRPPTLKVFRLAKAKSEGPCYLAITISSGETIKALNEQLAAAVVLDPQDRASYRVWKIEPVEDDWTALEFPASMLSSSNGKILEASDQTIEEADIQSDDCFVVEFMQDNAWIIDASATVPPPPLTVAGRPGAPAPLFNSNDGFFNRMGKSTTSSASTSLIKTDNYYNSLTPSWKTPSTQKEKALEPGTLGLGNMGNTCFMNSALQCLAHNKELTDYFLTGLYEEELNPDNPLGMHGAIAEAFGALLQRIWASTGASTSYSPREFKTQLQRFAPQFSGYQQHDSQELVAFLLDGLHEDLNRVLKKPYVEKPDWEGGGDEELVKLAQKSWEGYMKRNDSVIVDLFQGQYQSTLICPECQKVSITFDPFMYLTLPLPVQKKWTHTIYYVPWDLAKPHAKVPVEINRDASFKDLRNLLGRWMDAPPDNLITLEIFNNRFYKNLDDSLLCGDMADNDTIVCFELPCHSQQSRTYKKQPGDPIIVPVYLCDANPPLRPSYLSNKGGSLFGYPFVIAITQEQATDVNAMYDAVLTRLQRWTANSRDLFTWEEGPMSDVMDEVPLRLNGFPPVDSITEITIKENGEVVEVESDIVDGGMRMDEDMDTSPPEYVPQRVGTKKDVFTLRLQLNHKEFGTQYNHYSSASRWESWEHRVDQADTHPVLLREGDGLFCEFDENMKAYYFGEERSRWEHALWDSWEIFNHPDYAESKKAAADRKNKGISLHDCLDEFTKEEKLGEDDLWYCPQCKKHQQATKKFDLWKVPDVLVVHLKRFSNSRTLRDKIDTFIDFPVEGLDLGGMVGERAVAKRLAEKGVALEELQLGDLDEPLVYDLFGVDEHMGGLGGGHYRAYALNHVTQKWYHFDDSYVTPARATDAVNANAYLLFYRRRSATPLGGKTHHKIEEARSKPQTMTTDDDMKIDTQLPTPPSEDSGYMTGLTSLPSVQPLPGDPWTLRLHGSNPGSSVASPSPDDLPPLEESPANDLFAESLDPLLIASQRFDFPDPSGKASPTSSNEAEADPDTDVEDIDWEDQVPPYEVGVNEVVPGNSPDGQSGIGSPSSTISDMNPFSDVNSQSYDETNNRL
ncbi:Ubiquitin carboxyl-terminal hydrolase 4 [Hypsizygus marmoreus]|uniref:ubiquitinyl hydrolase 1 n=1 Tax=Hypsizygus marmoreus TaxID=39966 RepID=A0A369J5T9_HYPMA|nr:Ubiquitin carboxyl-terminal hydrolase 4 [Hypsizygus marmoreus]